METENERVYLSCAETAKYVRQALKENFPNTKFSVRSRTYAGGASIDIYWRNGAAESEVNSVAKSFEGAGFDGSIDLKYYKTHYLTKDGKVVSGNSPGTADSGGYHNGYEYQKPEGAREVHFGADFIFCNREITEDVATKIAEGFSEYNGHKFNGDLTANVDPNEPYRTLGTWWNCVWRFVNDKDLTNFNGVEKNDCTCGQWPKDFFKLKEAN